MGPNPALDAVIASVRPALNSRPTTEAERSDFLYKLVGEVYKHVKEDVCDPQDDTSERSWIGKVRDAAIPPVPH